VRWSSGRGSRPRHALLDDVAVAGHPQGIGCQVQADATGLTAASGMWVAGNVADVIAGVMQSASSGVTAAAAINADLTAEDTAALWQPRAPEASDTYVALRPDGFAQERG